MPRRRYFLLAVLLAACTRTTAAPPTLAPPPPAEARVTILHFNDVYEITPVEGGRSGGLARVAITAFLAAAREIKDHGRFDPLGRALPIREVDGLFR